MPPQVWFVGWDPSVWTQVPSAVRSHMQEGSEERGQRQPGKMDGAVLLSYLTAAPSPSEEERAPPSKWGTKGGKENALPVRIDNLAEDQLTTHFQVALMIC